jgi:hypothetical protein
MYTGTVQHSVTKDIVNPRDVAAPVLAAGPVNLDSLCPLSLIRTHTKTDDVPNVTDDQLRLYRKAAFEAAEQYTGMLFSATKQITEQATTVMGRRYRSTFKHRMRYPTVDGKVYLYGGDQFGTHLILVEPGTQTIRIPVANSNFIGAVGCTPCNQVNLGMKITYRAGFGCSDDVPAGIITGCLKYIAWLVSNPGDEIMSVRNKVSVVGETVQGTNNTAWASGALELWRQYVPGAI